MHPEKFLTEKNTLPPPALVDPVKKTMTSLRNRNGDKYYMLLIIVVIGIFRVLRVEKMMNEHIKIKEQLNLEDEKAHLMKKQEILHSVSQLSVSMKNSSVRSYSKK